MDKNYSFINLTANFIKGALQPDCNAGSAHGWAIIEKETRGWYGDTNNSTGVEETVYSQPLFENKENSIYTNSAMTRQTDGGQAENYRGWYGDTTNSTGVEESTCSQPHGNNGGLKYRVVDLNVGAELLSCYLPYSNNVVAEFVLRNNEGQASLMSTESNSPEPEHSEWFGAHGNNEGLIYKAIIRNILTRGAKMKSRIILFTILCVVFSSMVYSSFEPIGVGPRPVGMSNAYTAAADDSYSVYYNPAGLGRLKRAELATYYGSIYPGLSDNSNISQLFVAYAQTIGNIGNIGFGYYNFSLAGLYAESVTTLSYARKITFEGVGRATRKLDIGLSLKSLGKTYANSMGREAYGDNGRLIQDMNDPIVGHGYGKNAISVDLGLQYSPVAGYNIGFAVMNLNEPDLGLKDTDTVAREIKVGCIRESKDLLLSIDYSMRKFIDMESKIAFGAEKYFEGGFGIRGGIALGARQYTQLSAGMSYKIENLQFDYGILLPLTGLAANSTHRVGMTFKFGRVIDESRAELEKEIAARIKAEGDREQMKVEMDKILRTNKDLERALSESEKARITEEKTKAKRVATGEEKSSYMGEYVNSINLYNRRVTEGGNLTERISLLEGIRGKYANKGIDLSVVDKEYELVKRQYSESKKNYDISMDYYRRIISKSATQSEKIELLQSILKKYERTGIDLNEATNELRNLQGQ